VLPDIPGLRLNAVYLPATEVGGDFYQIFPQPDNSTLLVIGDVSGKGLRAAMTGTLVLGALRSLAQETLSPAQMLHRLNQQLATASSGGFVTCLILAITPAGTATLANAGHIPPYCNGDECKSDSALPLGLAATAEYTESTLHLAPGDTLTLLSDGVVEAQSPTGELYGFERTAAISNQSAEEIARAAQQFGQEDDITVLTVRRLAQKAA
jgi:serine phosphatase RsbU (regulator of sigma subunit)